MVGIRAHQRKVRRIPAAKHVEAMTLLREWWLVEAPNIHVARALVEGWPMRTTLPEFNARILNHGRGRG